MNCRSNHFHILHTLDGLNIPYVVIGAFAGSLYGITRVTFDVDIMVDLHESHIEALAAAYPPPRYYADPVQMHDSIRHGTLFNIIDTSAGRYVTDWARRLSPDVFRWWLALLETLSL